MAYDFLRKSLIRLTASAVIAMPAVTTIIIVTIAVLLFYWFILLEGSFYLFASFAYLYNAKLMLFS